MKTLPKAIIVILLFTFYFLLFTSNLNAQLSCDLCGKCGLSEPNDYTDCVACLYNGDTANPPNDGVSWTVIGCLETDPASFTQKTLTFTTAIIGGVIFIIMLYGSFLLLTSAGDPQQLGQGKGLIKSGIIALILIFFSVFILQFIGVS